MTYTIPAVKIGTLIANADLRTKQGFGVKLAGTGAVGLATAAGEPILGVLLNTPNTGEVCEIGVIGLYPVISGAAVAINGLIAVDANGKFQVTAVAGQEQVGFAVEAAAGADTLFTAFVNCGHGTA